MAALPEEHEEHEELRRSDALAYRTADFPSGYLVESEIAMMGRLGSGSSRRARILGRIAALLLLVLILLGIVLQVLNILAWAQQ
jgi:hypothetical protein